MSGAAGTTEVALGRSAIATAAGTHTGAFAASDLLLLLIPAVLVGGSFVLIGLLGFTWMALLLSGAWSASRADG